MEVSLHIDFSMMSGVVWFIAMIITIGGLVVGFALRGDKEEE